MSYAERRREAAQGRRFGLTMASAFVVVSGLLWWRGHSAAAITTGAICIGFLVAALVAPVALRPVERAWMVFAKLLSTITTPVFMGVVYFLVLTPTAFLVRLFRRNPMARVEVNGSYWVMRSEPEGGRSNLHRQF